MGRGYVRGQEAENKQVEIMEDRRDKVQAEYHVLELQPEGPLSESMFEACSLQGPIRLISVRQLDEEGYHVGFEDQQWKVTKGSLVVARGNKRGSLYMVEDWYEHVSFQRQCFRCTEGKSKFILKAMALHLLHQSEDPATMILLSKTTARVANGAESTGIRGEVSKMLWADSVSTTYLIYRIPYVPIGLRILEEEWRGKDTSLTHLKAAAQMKCDTAFGIQRVTKLSEVEILHLWTRFIKPDASSDMGEGSKNSGSFEDSGRSDKEYSEDGASFKEGGSEKNGEPDSYSEALGSKESVQWKNAIIKEMISLEKNQTGISVFLSPITSRNEDSQRFVFLHVRRLQKGDSGCYVVDEFKIPCIESLLALCLVGAACSPSRIVTLLWWRSMGIDSDGYDSEEDNLFLEYEPDPGELTRVVMEDIFGEPNVLNTHPTLCQDLDFTLSTDFSGSDLVVSFPSGNRNKTFDPGISIEVQSKRFLSLNKFYISFIRILVSKEEKSPHLLSHRGFKAFKIIHNFLNESPMMIYGGDIPIWDVPCLHFYPP
ncbi:retrovirus-related pol polyprotein from transposon TNT 1-94 [Tanacetum coccineum]